MMNSNSISVLTISGTPQQGQQLRLTLRDADGYSREVVRYQWFADGQPIANAEKTTLRLTQDEVGKAISVQAIYTDNKGILETPTSIETDIVINSNDLPTGYLSLEGIPEQGQRLRVNTSEIEDADGLGSFNYRWLADGEIIEGAVRQTLLLTQEQVGKVITAQVLYVDARGTSEIITSPESDLIGNINDVPTGNVSIRGLVTENQVLTATHDLHDADGMGDVSYQWLVDGLDISGATGRTLRLTTDLVGQPIAVRVTYVDMMGDENSVTSINTDFVGISKTGTLLNNTLNGSIGADSLSGLAGSDTLNGKAGNDLLKGGAGADTLNGSAGHDTLIGGTGKDILNGGTGADYFKFTSITESGLTSATRDTINDFVRGKDKIDLSLIDANTAAVGNQAFTTFIRSGGVFSEAGQLKIKNGILYGNTDSDTAAEFSIHIIGVTDLALADVVA